MKKIVATALVALFTSSPAFAATVINGSFESPEVTSVTYGNAGTTGGAGYEPNGGQFGYDNAIDGNQVLHLQGTGTGTLTVTGLVAGRNYTTSFFASARRNYAILPVSLSFGNTVIGTFTPTITAFTAFTGYGFTATGSTGTLTFAGLNLDPTSDQNAAIDLVTVDAVPEPATWAMMLLGFGMVGYGLRRRAGKVATRVAFS